jgi:SAM-dependent methyltransferase
LSSPTPPADKRQYQSFPNATGDSDTLAKLKALRLPALALRSFLDVGCNEGFFCGFALHEGANRVVGLDASAEFIARAQQHFPRAEFLCQSWDQLPNETFDVILLASSLHYAADQPALIAALVGKLSLHGTLVLELGLAQGSHSELVSVNRGIDVRSFPTHALLAEWLAPFAWKLIGHSVNQRGDPIDRFVVHITRRKPLAYLLLQNPGSAKTTIGRSLFNAAGIPLISGDQHLVDIAQGRVAAPAMLLALLNPPLDSTRLDLVIRKIVQASLLPELVASWIACSKGDSFAVDFFIPQDYHELVEDCFINAGYLAVRLTMTGMVKLESLEYARSAEGLYLQTLQNIVPRHTANAGALPTGLTHFAGIKGGVSLVTIEQGFIVATGAALHESGLAPAIVEVLIDNVPIASQHAARFTPTNIQVPGMAAASPIGFRLTAPAPEGLYRRDLETRVQICARVSVTAPAVILWPRVAK